MNDKTKSKGLRDAGKFTEHADNIAVRDGDGMLIKPAKSGTAAMTVYLPRADGSPPEEIKPDPETKG